MAKIEWAKAIEALVTLFNDPIMEVRNEAVAAAGYMDSRSTACWSR
ncbi:MAG: hypothetical protein U0361_15475 [Nitrospiraceae bacterium]